MKLDTPVAFSTPWVSMHTHEFVRCHRHESCDFDMYCDVIRDMVGFQHVTQVEDSVSLQVTLRATWTS